MKRRFETGGLVLGVCCCAAIFFALHEAALGGEIVLNENFDGMNLAELPPSWSKSEPSTLSIVDEAGHGKVMKISNRDERYAALMYNVELAKVAGKIVRVTVAAKFPAAYVPIADKLYASPKVILEAKDGGGKALTVELVPQAGKPDWQERKGDLTVPADAQSLTINLCVQFVTAEVFYDNLTLEIIGDAPGAAAPPPPPTPAPAVANKAPAATVKAGAKPATPAAPADPNSASGRAALAPRKGLADDGMAFSPDTALALQKVTAVKKATPNTVMYIGPGFTEKETLPKLSAAWKNLALSPKLTGKAAVPRHLLAALPKALVDDKPEVVLIAGDDAPGRKPTTTEAEDWEDVAKLCERYGAVPVLVVANTGSKDEAFENITSAMRKALDINNFIALAAQPQEVYLHRVSTLLTLLDQHVFLRGKLDELKTGGTGKIGKIQDE